jgi:hypothetical protein
MAVGGPASAAGDKRMDGPSTRTVSATIASATPQSREIGRMVKSSAVRHQLEPSHQKSARLAEKYIRTRQRCRLRGYV